MAFGENLFNNLLVAGILISLVIIIYCKVRNTTLLDVIKEVRAGFAEPIEYE